MSKQLASTKYLQEIQKIKEARDRLQLKKKNADNELDRLASELAKLDKQYILETNPVKSNELMGEKKSLYFEIEEYKNIQSTKYNPIVKCMLRDLEEYRNKAKVEFDSFSDELLEKEEQYTQQLLDYQASIRAKIDELQQLRHDHSFYKANAIYESLLFDKSDW